MMEQKHIVLDPRLSMIAEMVGRCNACADIGCDHGRLGAFLLQHGWVERMVLADISDPSLDKARALIRLLGLEARTRFLVCDGADALDTPVDVAVIAGMGGTTIAGIVERGRARLGNARLILQANVAQPELRARLSAVGYALTDERIVRDGRRLYVLMEAHPGKSEYDFREKLVGPVLLKERPALLRDLAAFYIRVARKALAGAEAGNEEQTARQLRRELEIWEDMERCL